MPERTTVVYYYDGTFAGLLACIYESYYAAEMPTDIVDLHAAQMQLFPGKQIFSHREKSVRVKNALQAKAGKRVYAFMQRAFLTCLPGKELALLRFARLAFARGAQVMDLLTHPAMLPLANAVTHLRKEVEQLLGFIRFVQYGEVLVSIIEPKNQVLPLLSRHFCDRFNGEAFLIFVKRIVRYYSIMQAAARYALEIRSGFRNSVRRRPVCVLCGNNFMIRLLFGRVIIRFAREAICQNDIGVI